MNVLDSGMHICRARSKSSLPLKSDNRRPGAVLVVDDDAGVRQTACDMFRACGFVVHEAANASDALRVLASRPEIGLLYADVRMPDMNGHDVALQARRLRPDLKVILTSAWLDRIHIGRARFLKKPVRLGALRECVEYAMRDTSATDAPDL